MANDEDNDVSSMSEPDMRKALASKLKAYLKSYEILKKFSVIEENQTVLVPKARKASKVYKELSQLMDEITDLHEEWLTVCGISADDLDELEDFIENAKYSPRNMEVHYSNHDGVIKSSIKVFQQFADQN